MRVPLVSLVVLLVGMASAIGQPSGTRLRGESESGRTRKRLTEAQQKLADGKPVADELQDILDQSGDDLVLVKDHQYQPARRLVHQYLASLPDKQLETFRDRIEEPAKRLLDQGKKKRDPKPLLELVSRYFVSRPAEEGLLLLGELAFERGDFVAAERHWRALLPEEGDGSLAYPKPKIEPVVVKSKVLLARAVGGDRDGLGEAVERFRKDYPNASGPLGGVNGVYAETLAKLVAMPPALSEPKVGWTGFAGGPSRDGRPDTLLPRFLAGERPRRVAIPREPRDKDRPPPILALSGKALAYHPVILNGSAYIADAGRVIQVDLASGNARVAFHAAAFDLDFDTADLAVPNTFSADFTLTAAGGQLFARFGKVALPTGNENGRAPRTVIACLEPKLDSGRLTPEENQLTARWHATPPVGREIPAAWEGAPVVAERRVYASFVRVDANRLVHAVACYPDTGGEPLWVTDVLDADPRANVTHRHELLTLAGGNVVYCSHTGVTVAVNAASGKPAWAFRNPPAERPPVVPFRDLCPAVYHDGRVFIAPADGDTIYALDADSGRKLWNTVTPVHVDQLLGVSRGRLIVTTHVARTGSLSTPSGGVRGYDVATGADKGTVGWQNHEDGTLNGLGRGVAGENLIFWPTAAGTKVLDPATGRVARPTNTKLPGNVAVANGYIVVATATEVWWYQFDGDAMVIPPRSDYPLVGVKEPPAFDAQAKVNAVATAFDPLTAPSLLAPAEENKVVSLPLSRPLIPISPPKDAPLVLCDGKKLVAHDADSGKPLWQSPLVTPVVFTRVAFTTDQLLALGDFGVTAADVKSGKIAWEFRVPEADPTPPLSSFTFVGNRLVAKVGDRGLIALDLGTGQVAWTRTAADEKEVYPYAIDTAPKFGPYLGAFGERVLVQRDQECWQLDAATGVRQQTYPTTLQNWISPPVEWHGKAAMPAADKVRPLIPSADGGVMELFGRGALNVYSPGREASRTGAPPALRTFGDETIAVIPRNIGDEVCRLEAVKGRILPPNLLPPGLDLEQADADDHRIYLPGGGKVFALNRDSLKESWRSTLPELPEGVRWKVLTGRTTLIVHPTVAIRPEPWDAGDTVRSFAYHPTALRLLGTSWELFDAATRFVFPVLILDSTTGKQLQRIDVAVGGPAVAVIPRSDGLLVAGVGRAVWLGRK